MLLATLISVSIWVSQDARKRGMSARWGIGVGLLLIVFLPLYFLVRRRTVKCAGCGNDIAALVSGKVLCGGQQTLSIQCRGGNLSGKRFELRAAENWAGAPRPRFSTMRDAHRPVRFLRVDRPSPSPGVSEMRGPLRRSSSAEVAFLLGSVLGDGLRATDLPREPAGHRSLPPIRDRETLSPGVSRHGGAQHSGRRQRNTRLAHLRRVCPCLD